MSRTADPLKRLSAANPVPLAPTVDWERIQQHVTRGASEPRGRRPRLLVIAGTSCAGMLVLAAIVAVLLSGASKPGRAPSSSQVGCDRGHNGCSGTSQVGVLSHAGVLPPLGNPNQSVKPAAVQSCAVIGPHCVQGCAIPVASPLRASPKAAPAGREDLRTEQLRDHPAGTGQGCTTKTAEQACVEDVARMRTRPATGNAVREDFLTERLLVHATGASTPFCRSLFRELPTKHFPHRAQKRRQP